MTKWWLEPKHNAKPEGATHRGPHAMTFVRGIGKQVCDHCGLVGLNNEATRHALRQGCWRYPDG